MTEQISTSARSKRVNGTPSSREVVREVEEVVVEPTSPRSLGSTSPRSRSARYSEMAAEGDIVSSDKVIEDLEKLGFEVRERIVVNVDDEARMPFIRVITPMGHTVFVKLDRHRVRCNRQNLTFMQVAKGVVIPDSVRNATYKCAMDSALSGVSMVCNGSICVMAHEGDPQRPHETTFVYSTRFSERRIQVGDMPIAYPVVRYAELVAEPCKVIKIIHDATCHIRREVKEKIMYELRADCNSTKASIKRLNEAFARTEACIEHKLNWISADTRLRTAEDYQRYYIEHPPCEPYEIEKMMALRRLLDRSNELLVCDLRAAQRVNQQRERIDEVSDTLEAACDYLKQDYEALETEMNKACGVPAVVAEVPAPAKC
jgi:hypothetical protein